MKYYVCSDTHGFYSLLIESLEKHGFFEDKEPHKLVIIGDFFDRGNEAIKMQEFLVKELEKDEVILIKGNHEDLVQELIDNIYIYSPGLKNTHHYRNSTVDTCLQLTGFKEEEIITRQEEFVNKMYETDLFKKIIPSCIDYLETPHYIFTHGYIPCFALGYGQKGTFSYDESWRNANKERWRLARWYNGMQANFEGVREPNKTIVCGHWHCSYGHCYIERVSPEFGENADFTPYYGNGIIAIDGCVPRSFHVNIIVIED